MSSLRRDHANLLCIVPILTDVPCGIQQGGGNLCTSTGFGAVSQSLSPLPGGLVKLLVENYPITPATPRCLARGEANFCWPCRSSFSTHTPACCTGNYTGGHHTVVGRAVKCVLNTTPTGDGWSPGATACVRKRRQGQGKGKRVCPQQLTLSVCGGGAVFCLISCAKG